MKKIIIIRRKSTSDWVSCQSITRNLESLYKVSFPDQIEVIEVNSSSNKFESWEEAKNILKQDASHIVFIDHFPHPANLIESLSLLTTSTLPNLIFHIFGDFTLQSKHWLSIESTLNKVKADFICASDKQVSLLKKLIDISSECIHKIPFPIDTTLFNFDDSLTNNNNKFQFLYSGRLSDQKNIIQLIQHFDQFNKTVNPESKLVIAGPYDDLGNPFLGKSMKKGSYALLTENLVTTLNNENIEVVGNCSHHELKKLYHQSDAYISLSTHNDEDYGMAPAEALCTGLKCLLTDWGGFSSFKRIDSNNVELLEVTIKKDRILPDYKEVIKKMNKISNTKLSTVERTELSKKARASLSIDSLKESLIKVVNNNSNEKLKCFNKDFHTLSSTHVLNGNTPYFKSPNGGYSKLYKEIYTSYFKRLENDN